MNTTTECILASANGCLNRARIAEAVDTVAGVQAGLQLLDNDDLNSARRTAFIAMMDERLEAVITTLMQAHDDLAGGGE